MISGMGKLSYSNVNAGEAGGIAVPAVSISFIVCPAPSPTPSTSGICPHHQLTPPTLHTHREQRAGGKMGRGKMMKCRLQLPAFQPLPLPTTLFASTSNQLSTQGHTDSLLSAVPRPGLGLAFTSLYHSCKQRTLVPQVKQGFVLKCRFVHCAGKRCHRRNVAVTQWHLSASSRGRGRPLQHGKVQTKKIHIFHYKLILASY